MALFNSVGVVPDKKINLKNLSISLLNFSNPYLYISECMLSSPETVKFLNSRSVIPVV